MVKKGKKKKGSKRRKPSPWAGRGGLYPEKMV